MHEVRGGEKEKRREKQEMSATLRDEGVKKMIVGQEVEGVG